jgi:hypothetical protein
MGVSMERYTLQAQAQQNSIKNSVPSTWEHTSYALEKRQINDVKNTMFSLIIKWNIYTPGEMQSYGILTLVQLRLCYKQYTKQPTIKHSTFTTQTIWQIYH